MSKMSNLPLSDVLFQALNAPKLVFVQGFDPDPAGGAYDAPPRLLSRLGRGPSPYHSLRRLRHLDLGDCGASIDTSPDTNSWLVATPMVTDGGIRVKMFSRAS